MLYLDTSLLIALIATEARRACVKIWPAAVDDVFMTSDRGLAEVASALSIKELTERGRDVADRVLSRFLVENIEVMAVQRANFRIAAGMPARPMPPLRAADALYLAVAARHGAVLNTLDDGQAAGGCAHGIDVVITVERE